MLIYIKNQMVKFEKGVDIISTIRWKTFGKFIINYMLITDLVLNIRYISGSQVPAFKGKIPISIELSNVITSILDTGEINYTLIKELKDKEKVILNNLIKLSGLSKQLNYRASKIEASTKDLKDRYNILTGELQAGNNSKIIKNQLIEVINQLVEHKVIKQEDYH